jgi:hypothetical protein
VIHDLGPDLRPIAEELCRMIRRAAPDLEEAVKWNVPVWSGSRNALCLMLYPDHVNLGFFQGATLGKEHPEIEGTGKALRHVKVRTVADARRPKLASLVRAAVALDRDGAAGPARRAPRAARAGKP